MWFILFVAFMCQACALELVDTLKTPGSMIDLNGDISMAVASLSCAIEKVCTYKAELAAEYENKDMMYLVPQFDLSYEDLAALKKRPSLPHLFCQS